MTAPSSGDALVVLPTYNERDTVGRVIELLATSAGERIHVLVVDDSSPDGTAAVVRGLTGTRVHLLERPSKQGLGSAYVAGFRWGLERGYRALVEMDADLSHDPCDVPRLLEALEGADLVIGSRYVTGGNVRNWGLVRRGLSLAGNRYARTLLHLDVADSTSGLRAYRSSWLRGVDLAMIHSEGYAFQVEMAYRVARDGGRIVELPIVFTERAAGRSKMSRAIVIEALLRIALWSLRDRGRGFIGRMGGRRL